MENTERYEQVKKEILKCIDNKFVMPKNLPIPFERSVIVKQMDNVSIVSESGLILGGIEARNILKPNIGIIVAVGPKVPDYLVPKLRVYFNQNIDFEYFIGGAYYKMSDFSDFYAAVPEDALVSMDTKTDKELAREDLISQNESYENRTKGMDDRDILDALKNPKFKA